MPYLQGMPAATLLLGCTFYGVQSGIINSLAAQTSSPQLRWSPCQDVPDTECAGLDVPMDYARPDGPQFTLRLGRLPALHPGHRKGVLLSYPAGRAPGSRRSSSARTGKRSMSMSLGVSGIS